MSSREFAVWTLWTAAAWACSCGGVMGLETSSDVFEGRIVDLQYTTEPWFGSTVVTLEVRTWWKGQGTDRVEVRTESGGATCGLDPHPAVGQDWLMFTERRPDGTLITGLCTATKRDGEGHDLPPPLSTRTLPPRTLDPVEQALVNRDPEALQQALSAGASVYTALPDGSPMELALAACDAELVEVLVDAGARLGITSSEPPTWALECTPARLADIVRALQKSGPSRNAWWDLNSIFRQLLALDLARAEAFLVGGIDPDHVSHIHSALSDAARGGREAQVGLLEKYGATWTPRAGVSATQSASPAIRARALSVALPADLATEALSGGAARYADSVAYLLGQGANPDGTGPASAVQVATLAGCGACVDALIAAGATPAPDWLEAAVRSGDPTLLERLLAAGAHPSQADVSRPVLHIAIGQRNEAMVRRLVAAEANVDGIDGHGRVPLHIADNQGQEWVDLMLELGADPKRARMQAYHIRP